VRRMADSQVQLNIVVKSNLRRVILTTRQLHTLIDALDPQVESLERWDKEHRQAHPSDELAHCDECKANSTQLTHLRALRQTLVTNLPEEDKE
jgi:hypothetical protein